MTVDLGTKKCREICMGKYINSILHLFQKMNADIFYNYSKMCEKLCF